MTAHYDKPHRYTHAVFLPRDIVAKAGTIAFRTNRTKNDVLVEWLATGIALRKMEVMSDDLRQAHREAVERITAIALSDAKRSFKVVNEQICASLNRGKFDGYISVSDIHVNLEERGVFLQELQKMFPDNVRFTCTSDGNGWFLKWSLPRQLPDK